MDTRTLSLDLIDAPLVQERAAVDGEEFRELVADVAARGILQPILVRPVDGRFRVAAGDRRRRAAIAAGLLEIPAVVHDLSDEDELAVRYRENAHRVNPNPVEEGALFAAMHEGLHLTAAGIAERVGKSAAYVGARLELVYGPPPVREAVLAGEISFSVARELLRCAHPTDLEHLLYHARRGGCTADLMRSWVAQAARTRAAQPAGTDPAAPVVSRDTPPVLLGVCEWHEGQVPLDGLLSYRVCAACYQALRNARDELKAQDAAAGGGGADAPAS